MSISAVDHWGANTLLGMNKVGGGTNRPKMGTPVLGATGGGIIQPMQGGGVVIGAGHAPSKDKELFARGLGDDLLPVEGTREFEGRGVYEYEATDHLVNTLKRMIPNTSIADRVSFESIRTYEALTKLPPSIEKRGNQFVTFHFDARGTGRPGVLLPHPNQVSPIDRALMDVFGRYPGIEPHEKAVTNVGGTIVELERIDHPALKPFLREVEQKKVLGPASQALATKVINPLIQGLGPPPQSPINTPPSSSPQINPSPGQTPSVPPPSSNNGSGNTTTIIGGGVQQQQTESSATSAAQSSVPSISSQDFNNAELFVIKSIYNIID